MKRPLKLSLAIALALGATDAFALGLGPIQVRSGLNQPLIAEIPVIQGTPGEAEGLIVQLASADDFDRVGLNRASIGVPIEFSLAKNARGEPVIRITSTDIVREPFLGFLVEANWPKGRLLREYTVLLDPPVMAPAVKGSSAVAVAAAEPQRATAQPMPESKPAKPAPAAKPAAPAKPVAATEAPAPAAPRAAASGEYGPVAAGETLGEVARATRPNESVSVNQMMLALLKSNPNAFYRDNINALKRGAVLRIPSAEEISASGSARDAAAAVRSQIDEWRGGAASAPTLVADTAPAATASPKPAAASTPAAAPKGERLALVPPREGKAGEQAADRPGSGNSGSGDGPARAELARVKEALTSREQESSELKSRVKDLEDIKGKNDKLIALQNSELAELRDKLKAMQDAPKTSAASTPTAASTPPATVAPVAATPAAVPPATASTPASTPAATTPPVTKDDIWGDGDKAAAKPPVASATTTAPPPVAADAATGNAPPADPSQSVAAPSTPASLDATNPAPASDGSVTATPPATAVVEPTTKPEPATTKPATPAAKPPTKPATPRPVVAETPWYLEPWALGAAGVAGLLLVLLGVSGMRKRKVADASPRTSIANSFGDAPLGDAFSPSPLVDAEEEQLIDQVRRDPGNAGAHLELLSLYYAKRDASKFEVAAEEMYAYIADPNQAEWREARAMGEELVPSNPLFGGVLADFTDAGLDRDASAFRFDEPAPVAPETDYASYPFDEPEQPAATDPSLATTTMPAFDFNAPPARADADDNSFSFDLPPIEPAATAPVVTEHDLEIDDGSDAGGTVSDDEFFAGEDAIGTKLDLAKAYLDMGDPDGARAMLEEVLAEGSPLQQAEARKLIGEIH